MDTANAHLTLGEFLSTLGMTRRNVLLGRSKHLNELGPYEALTITERVHVCRPLQKNSVLVPPQGLLLVTLVVLIVLLKARSKRWIPHIVVGGHRRTAVLNLLSGLVKRTKPRVEAPHVGAWVLRRGREVVVRRTMSVVSMGRSTTRACFFMGTSVLVSEKSGYATIVARPALWAELDLLMGPMVLIIRPIKWRRHLLRGMVRAPICITVIILSLLRIRIREMTLIASMHPHRFIRTDWCHNFVRKFAGHSRTAADIVVSRVKWTRMSIHHTIIRIRRGRNNHMLWIGSGGISVHGLIVAMLLFVGKRSAAWRSCVHSLGVTMRLLIGIFSPWRVCIRFSACPSSRR